MIDLFHHIHECWLTCKPLVEWFTYLCLVVSAAMLPAFVLSAIGALAAVERWCNRRIDQ